MSRPASKAFLKALEQSRCSHKFVDSKHCLKCGVSFKKLQRDSQRELEWLQSLETARAKKGEGK